MVYKPNLVANSFLKRGRDEGIADIDPLKLQKLVYCMHGWNLATRNEPVVGEYFEAWPYGPVLSSLYHEFKSNGRHAIKGYAVEIDPASGKNRAQMVGSSDTRFYEVFDRVWNRYKRMSGLQLSALTHAEGTPWAKARKGRRDYLDNHEIRSHFLDLSKTAH